MNTVFSSGSKQQALGAMVPTEEGNVKMRLKNWFHKGQNLIIPWVNIADYIAKLLYTLR